MSFGPLFDHGEQLRDAGIAQVLEGAGNDWKVAATRLIETVLSGEEVMAEQMRQLCQDHGIEPHHPNAWGALTNSLARAGVIVDTGRVSRCKDPRSHARRNPIWRVR